MVWPWEIAYGFMAPYSISRILQRARGSEYRYMSSLLAVLVANIARSMEENLAFQPPLNL